MGLQSCLDYPTPLVHKVSAEIRSVQQALSRSGLGEVVCVCTRTRALMGAYP